MNADVFVFLDQAQYPKNSVANRNYIKSAHGKLLLTKPVRSEKKSSKETTYLDLVSTDERAKQKLLKTIKQAYAKAPYFSVVLPFIERLIESERFSRSNCEFISEVSLKLGYNGQFISQSEIEVDGKQNELLIAIIKKVGGETYLSGKGATSYNNPDLFKANGIELQYQNFKHPEYPQLHGAFVSHLSVIDALFNIGFEGTSKLIRES